MKKSNKILIGVIITLLVVIIIALICLLVIQSQKANNTEKKEGSSENVTEPTKTPEQTSTPELSEEKALTSDELKEIENYIKDNNKSLFLVPEYKEVKDIDLYFQIRYGYDEDLKVEEANKEEVVAFLRACGNENEEDIEFFLNEFRVNKYTKDNMNKYLKENLNVSVDDVDISSLKYIKDYNAYFDTAPTDAFGTLDFEFVSGKVLKNGMYEIKYVQEVDDYEFNWTLVLEKNDNKYIFISNVNDLAEKIEKIERTSGLSHKTVAYTDTTNCEMYYKNNVLYYAKIGESTYYFENGKFLVEKNDKGSCLSPYVHWDEIAQRILKLFENNKV